MENFQFLNSQINKRHRFLQHRLLYEVLHLPKQQIRTPLRLT